MSNFLFEKKVDQSLLKAGLTIPVELQDKIQEVVGVRLNKGDKTEIIILLEGKQYKATLNNVNFSEGVTNRVVFQIRYSESSPLCQKLKELFHFAELSAADFPAGIIEIYAGGNNTLEFKVKNGMKVAFLNYLGPVNSIAGYQRSYKLVFYKVFFERLRNGQETSCDSITTDFRQYYIQRKNAGLIPDLEADPVVTNIDQSTLPQVRNLILKNPFNAISSHGFMTITDQEVFELDSELKAQLPSLEIEKILEIVEQKLKLYYSKIDNHEGHMKEIIEKILNDYVPAKQEPFAGHPIGAFFRNDIPQQLYGTGLVDSSQYLVTGSVGQGNWAMVPWVCIFDRKITTSATKGVYIVYLLSKEGNSLYLTFNQGCTNIRNNHSKRETIQIMRKRAAEIALKIDSRGFKTDEEINLGNGITELGELYQKGTIFYKEYKKGSVPEEEELIDDLSKMIEIYKEYAEMIHTSTSDKNSWLLTWNPVHYAYTEYEEKRRALALGKQYIDQWACSNKHAQIGDRVYLMRIGAGESNGIIASGYVSRASYLAPHYDIKRASAGEQIQKIDIEFDNMLDRNGTEFLDQRKLKSLFPLQQWSPQASGIEIKSEYRDSLEKEWQKYIGKRKGEKDQMQASMKETIAQIKEYIAAKGFTYADGMIENFYLSLKSKPFVILAGTSGTGKTRLVKLFAEAVGATTANGRYKMVSVRPDWSDSSDLFGHVDLNGAFVPGAIIEFVKKASVDLEHPYFLCLDEMNLARVEYYMSDFLSVIETRELIEGRIETDPLVSESYYGSKLETINKYGSIQFPENLYVIGTVNMDETTFPFSRKVLDRANTIEFSFVDLTPLFEQTSVTPVPLELNNDFLKTKYLLLSQCADQQEAINAFCAELQNINGILQQASAHVGYRVRDEIIFYLLNNKESNLLDENAAMDNEILQKILPRIQGSAASIKKMLCDLFKVCAGDYEGQQTESDLASKMMAVAKKADCKYKKSAEKIAFMVRRYEEDGFTSYWL